MKKETLYERIYNDIVEGIRSRQYPPGSRLPSEKELSDQYQVSRITSKKALEMLADKNMIKRMAGKGSYVSEESQEAKFLQPIEKIQSGQTKTIGVIMDAFGASYGYQLLLGIERECYKNKLSFALRCTYGNKAAEIEAIEELLGIGVSGIIIMCVHDETYNEEVLKLTVENFPIVLIDRQLKGIPIPFVGTDNYQAAMELTEWLFDHGHKNTCFVTHASMQTTTILERKRGFVDCHLAHNIITNEAMWITNLRSMLPTVTGDKNEIEASDFHLIMEYVKANPTVTAFFAVEYSIGILVYKVLKSLGLDKEKVVVFFDGIDEHYDPLPKFTRIRQDEYQIGVNSVDLIIDKIEGKANTEARLIPYAIIEGQNM